VAKLVDAADSKSAGAKHRAGSIPASGTTFFQGAPLSLILSKDRQLAVYS
jgi:hypothetical protein